MSLQAQQGTDWQYGVLGCFGDWRLCLMTFVAPCYTVGKNAEHFGEDCLLVGLLSCLGLNPGPIMRWRLREERRIAGSMILDTLVYFVLPCCAMVQEAREIGWALPQEVATIGKKNDGAAEASGGHSNDAQDMTRE